MEQIRIGTVSSVDKTTGMISVFYKENNNVTQNLPYLTFNDEVKFPEIGASVAVIHLSTGSSMGVVLGTYWNKSNIPDGIEHSFYKKLGDGAYFSYDEDTGKLVICAKNLILKATDDDIEVSLSDVVGK